MNATRIGDDEADHNIVLRLQFERKRLTRLEGAEGGCRCSAGIHPVRIRLPVKHLKPATADYGDDEADTHFSQRLCVRDRATLASQGNQACLAELCHVRPTSPEADRLARTILAEKTPSAAIAYMRAGVPCCPFRLRRCGSVIVVVEDAILTEETVDAVKLNEAVIKVNLGTGVKNAAAGVARSIS